MSRAIVATDTHLELLRTTFNGTHAALAAIRAMVTPDLQAVIDVHMADMKRAAAPFLGDKNKSEIETTPLRGIVLREP